MTTPKERTDPTDRSIPSPPEITTNVCPNATIPRKTDIRSMSMICEKLKKPGKMISPKIKSRKTAAILTKDWLNTIFFKDVLDRIATRLFTETDSPVISG